MATLDSQLPIVVSKIAIIGAGVSGIAAAKQLSQYNPIVFEATDSIGGIWKHCSYKITKLQSQTWNYEFSDFPWPKRENNDFPTHVEVLNYLESYAERFDLVKFVKFNSKVLEVRYVEGQEGPDSSGRIPGDHGKPLPGHPVWELAVQTNGSDAIQRYHFEFVVVCTGKYGDIPLMPAFPRNKGPEVFKGKVLHSLDYCKLDREGTNELLKGKKVVVVGYKKSAIDLALECAQANQGPDGQPCTMVVRSLHWTLPHYRIWGVPFFMFYATRSAQFFHGSPNQGLLRSLLCLLFSPMRQGISKFIESYLSWKLPLDKGTIHPLIPNMAFVGYVESVSNLYTSEIRSMWLSGLIDGKFKLPGVEKMLAQIFKDIETMKKSTRFYKRHCITTFSINHNDEICEDLGWNSWRKKSWIKEVFSPYFSGDYNKED
ncbi:Flavin monooxygenase FMO [Sesbania bispinosa]|nr:Flavin monooxygenase FMO [Sesbania bispinosa]